MKRIRSFRCCTSCCCESQPGPTRSRRSLLTAVRDRFIRRAVDSSSVDSFLAVGMVILHRARFRPLLLLSSSYSLVFWLPLRVEFIYQNSVANRVHAVYWP